MDVASVPPGFVASSWNGSPTTLAKGAGTSMPVTPNGSLIVGYFNTSTQNSAGRLSVTSGGSQPQYYDVPPLQRMMNLLINNWGGSNLNLVNVSTVATVGIYVQAFGPGIPNAAKPGNLPIGQPIQLSMLQAAQGVASPNNMLLSFTSNPGYMSIMAVVGGPPDQAGNNAYVFALNAPYNSGPNTGVTPPSGYYATTIDNTYAFPFNWGASVVYVVNMSPQAPAPVTVLLQSL
jgi:hypothetical protein